MDKRKALEKGYILSIQNSKNGIVNYIIRNEIGRGGTCIVYDAYYYNNINEERTVRIKECYPFNLRIERLETGELIPSERDYSEFQMRKVKIVDSFRQNNKLFSDTSLTNSVSNTLDIYKANGTVYIVTIFQAGNVLSKETISSLKDAVNIVKAVAKTVKNIHDNGFLYLDIKPSNIYIYNDTTEVVQLFDFDSLIPISALNSESINEYRISFSSGFAALEQKTANTKRIGKHTDVFGVGALLFYMVFGHAPTAFDCESDASYKYEQGLYPVLQYQDRLFRELTAFFHKSIASFYADRYKELNEAIDKLQIIAELSDVTKPFIFSTPIIAKKRIVGREEELKKISNYLKSYNCLFVTGMGGIGKSSLVRKYISDYKDEYDSCNYLFYEGNAINLIVDDSQLRINTVQKTPEETSEEYFRRKSKNLRKILNETTSLIVIDNYTGDIGKTFLSVLSLGWKVIVISREEAPSDNYPQIRLKAVKSKDDLHQLFEMYLNRDVSEEEYPFLDKIIERVDGHTLVLELIAKQLVKSYFNIEEAYTIVVEKGFSDIAPEKINYEKDSLTSSNTIRNIIAEIFPSDKYGIEYRRVLKGLSLFDSRGIKIDIFSEMLSLKSHDSINEMVDDQWIEREGERILLHSVIREVINNWKWENVYKDDIDRIIRYLFVRLKLESQREEIPADFLQILRKSKEASESKNRIKKRLAKLHLERLKSKGLIGEILLQRIERGGDEAVTDKEVLTQLLSLSEAVLSNCSKIKVVEDGELYSRLKFWVLINTPREREDYILQGCLELLESDFIKHEDNARYDLYDGVLSIYLAKQDYGRAWEIIQEAKHGLVLKNNNVKGLFYCMLAGFYDARLDGAYATDNEYQDRKSLLKAIDESIKYYKRSSTYGTTGYRLTQSYISKAITLMRCFPERKEEIVSVLHNTRHLCEQYTQSYSSLRKDYYMCCAWYFTYVEPDKGGCIEYIRMAYEIEKEIITSDLDLIDDCLAPFANMYIEHGMVSESVGTLRDAIQLCEKNEHKEIIPYLRKKIELYAHVFEIYYNEKYVENSRDVLKTIDEMNEKYRHLGIHYEIPTEIRENLIYFE